MASRNLCPVFSGGIVRRDPKGLYVKARRGEIAIFTGVTDPYESPENSEIIVRTEDKMMRKERILKGIKGKKTDIFGLSGLDQRFISSPLLN